MRQYFKNHPVINYNGLNIRNLMLNAQLTKSVLGSTTTFLPYTVQEGETPTTIAFDYYGSVDYTWLVLFSNSIIDPYTGWPKSQEQFDEFLVKEHQSVSNAIATIHHYKNTLDPDLPPATPTTYLYMTESERTGYVPVSLYDYLHEVNEGKRQIRLVDKVYAARIALELEKKLRA